MIDILIHMFIKDRDNIKDRMVRTSYGNLAAITGVVCNILLFIGKYMIGLFSGSIAIMADAINNLSDASSNIVSLLGFRLSAKKPDAEHPYGHARYEYVAGLVVCVIILAIGLSLVRDSLIKIISPEKVAFSWTIIIILLASIGVKLWMFHFNSKIGRLIQSDTLKATAADSRNDVITTSVVVIASFLCHYTGFYRLDGIMGLAVAAFILVSGANLAKDTLSPLLGEAPSKELVKHIEEVVMRYPGVMGMHDLLVHDYGPGNKFASLHVEFPADVDVIISHDTIDNMERYFLEQENLPMTVHYDPIVTTDCEVNGLRTYLSDCVKSLNLAYSIHDLRIVPGVTHTNVIFDCVVPPEDLEKKDEIISSISTCLKERDEKYVCIIHLEQSFV